MKITMRVTIEMTPEQIEAYARDYALTMKRADIRDEIEDHVSAVLENSNLGRYADITARWSAV